MTNRFVISQNIGRFRRLLAIGCDDVARAVLTELLVAEEHKLAELDMPPGDDEAAKPPGI
jgi:hypothetical protein